MQEFRRSPFIKIVIAFIVGIVVQQYFKFDWEFLKIFFCVNLLLIILFKLLPLKFQFIGEKYLNLLYFLLIITLGSAILKYRTRKIPTLNEKSQQYLAVVQDIPIEKENSTEMILLVKAKQNNNDWIQQNAKVLTYIEKDSKSSNLNPGDNIIFESNISNITNYGNPKEFNYKQFLAAHSIYHQAYIPADKWEKIKPKTNSLNSVRSISNSYRHQLIKAIETQVKEQDQLAVASALVLGYKDYLTQDIKNSFSASGASHILAVSGLHVGIIYLLLHYILFFMEKRQSTKILKTLLIVFLLIGYAFLTGLSASVARATLMFTLIAIARITGRDSSIYNTLAFSAFILLFINPLLLFSLSFRLSYLAVLSIVFFQPRIYKNIQVYGISDKLWQWLTVAIAAQIGTAPLVIHYFNQFPTYFWLTNFIAIPAATIIVITGILFFLLYPLAENIAEIFGWLLQNTIDALNKFLEIISNLPFSVLSDIYVNPAQVILIYGTILATAWLLIQKSGKQIIIILTIIVIFLMIDISEKHSNINNKELIIYNIPNHSAYNYISHSQNLVITDSTFNTKRPKNLTQLHFFTRNYWKSRDAQNPTIKDINRTHNLEPATDEYLVVNNFMNFKGTTIFRPSVNYPDTNKLESKIKVDYVILSRDNQFEINTLKKTIEFGLIILDSSIPYYKRRKLKEQLNREGIPFHDVSVDGAYCIDLV
ncbi:MAG: ComEC/Rec2 family competence protein [Bacteroidales bacterium]